MTPALGLGVTIGTPATTTTTTDPTAPTPTSETTATWTLGLRTVVASSTGSVMITGSTTMTTEEARLLAATIKAAAAWIASRAA